MTLALTILAITHSAVNAQSSFNERNNIDHIEEIMNTELFSFGEMR